MTEVAAATSVSDRYDSSLSYEERARLRRKKRQEAKSQMTLDISSQRSASSITNRSNSPTPPYRSGSSPTPTPRYHPSPTSLESPVQNGLVKPVSPLVGSKKNFHSFDSGVSMSNGTDVSSSSIIVKSKDHPGKPRGILKKRLNSEPPGGGGVSSHSKPTPVQVPLAESRVHPVISASGRDVLSSSSRPRALSDNTVLDQPRVSSLAGSSHARSSPPQSPHSPLVKKIASVHLINVIGRQQQRESSCSPSPRTPVSKQQEAKSRERVFSFPDVSDKDKTAANGSSSRDTENASTLNQTDNKESRETKTTQPHTHNAPVEVASKNVVSASNGKIETLKTAHSGDVFDDADGASLSRHSGSNSNVSTSSSFTYESFEWRRAGSNPPDLLPPSVQQPKSFAEGLKFFDTTDSKSDSISGTSAAEKETLVMKTNVVFHSIDEMNDDDITMIPRGVFFDPSQSQLDAFPERFPPIPVYGAFGAGQAIKEESPVSEEALKDVKKEKKTSKSKSKESKSPLRMFKKNSAIMVLEEESPDSAEVVVNDGSVTPRSKKKDSSSKKSSLKKKRSVSESQVNSNSPTKTSNLSKNRIHSSSQITPTHNKPPLPNSGDHSNKSTPTHMLSSKPPLHTALSRPYSSFREDKVKSPESTTSSGLSKISMPDLSNPSSRGTTPDASGSSTCMSPENDTKSSGKKTKSSIRQRISIGMRGLMGKDSSAGSSSPVVLKHFRKLDTDSFSSPTTSLNDSSGLTSASSESQLSALTEHDLNTMLEDTEMIPRTYSLECILPKYEERGVDVFPTDERKVEEKRTKEDIDESNDSDSEYHTASESESFSEIMTSSTRSTSEVLVTTSGSYDGESREVHSQPKQQLTSKSESSLTQKTNVRNVRSPLTDKKLPSIKSSKVETQKLKVAQSPKRVSSLKETSSRVTTAKPSALSSSTRGSKAKDSSLRSSLKSTTKTSSLAKPTGRASPIKSPVSTRKPITKPTSSRKPLTAASHSQSPLSTRKSNASPVTSPLSTRKSNASPVTSPLTSRKSNASPVTSPLSSRSTTPSKKAITQTSPLAKKKLSPSKVSPSSTSLKRVSSTKSSSSSSPSPRSSQRSKVGAAKHAPPMLSKGPLESTSGTDLSPKTSPSFSRFARGRVPIKLRSASVSDHPTESLSERVQRIKEHRKSHHLPVENSTTKSASNPSTPARVKKRPTSPLNLSTVPRSSHSSLASTPSTPSSDKKRRIGISLDASPVHIEERLSGAGLKMKEIENEEPVTEQSQDTDREVSALSLDVDMLLSSVGEKLDSMELFPTSPPHSKPTTFEAVTASQESDLGPSPVLVHVTDETSIDAPDIAKMPFSVFSPTSLHSRESSFDFDNEPRPTTTNEPIYNHLEPIYYDHLAPKEEEEEQTPPDAYFTPDTSPLPSKREASKKELTSKKSLLATKKSTSVSSPRTTKKVNVSSPVSLKKGTSSKTASVSGKLSVPNQKTDLLSKSGSKHLSPVLEKREREDERKFEEKKRSPLFMKKRGSAPVVKGLPTAKSDSKLATKQQPAFTSALPPKPPSMRKIQSEVHTAKRVSSADRLTTSSTGQTRPRNVVIGRPSSATASPLRSSMRKSTPASSTHLKVSTSASSGGGGTGGGSDLKSKSTASLLSGGLGGRGGIRASAKSKRASVSATPLHRVQSGGTTLAPSNVSVRKSMRSKSTHIRPNSASTLPRRGSAGAATLLTSSGSSSLSQGSATRGPSTLASAPARRSMKRTSSSDRLTRMVKPGSSATLNRERKPSRDNTNVYASMRRVSTAGNRPSSASTSTLRRSSVTKSMRHSVTSKSSSSITHKPSTQLTSPSRSRGGTLKRSSSGGEVLAAFDHISAQAQGSLLTGSDHRRNVRPKLRQKASSSHLKMLRQRKDISTELIQSDESSSSMVDPNSYSTYMSKKNLDPTAIAGLAAKLDFTTVKLRKTGIVEQMLSEQNGGSGGSTDNRVEPPGMEYNTQHPIMLLQVKGRRFIQTRLVKPSSSSLNSGDVFIALTDKQLFHWVGKSANVIEKARGSDVVMRILHKKELKCHATSVTVFKEEDNAINRNSKKYNAFWDLLGGNDGVKSSESVPSDELYEKAVNLATMVYQLEGDKENAQFVPIHENTSHMVKVSLLHSTLILLFDFVSEVYLWLGRRSPPALRKKALELAKAAFDAGCKQPVFNLRSSPARASGRYRPKSAGKSPRHSVVNSSGRRTSRVSKSDMKPRPEWALFARVVEGAESILFREKFSDWPEPGRIIKMKGHTSSGEAPKFAPSAELRPADVEKMLKPIPGFEGLRLEGENIHRGQGNFKVSRSTFACNRVRTDTITKWVVKEFDNVAIDEKDHGIFYESEAYVIRWSFLITVVRELEGLVPGQGMFARDRQYQKALLAKAKRAAAPEAATAEEVKKAKKEDSDSECSDVDSDDETKRILESGGRDRVAYFFWQGESATVNEKGASALMTIELDKERGPQVRVVQNKEPPAFLNLFNGGMIILHGRSETNSLQSTDRHCRVFCIRTQVKSEACLQEITPGDEKRPLSSLLRSRGSYVFYHIPAKKLYLWQGSKSTHSLKKASSKAAKSLRNRLGVVELIPVQEGEEPNDFCALVGDNKHYLSMAKETRLHDYTPRLFELTSTTGEFVAAEVINTIRNGDTEAFPFLQSDIYSTIQPAIFLLDAHYEVYVWLGWWPQEKNKLLKEHNATTGSAHARWLRDKKLALETAQHYVKACNRTRTPRAYMVSAGTEHEKFINIFPFWEVNQTVLEQNCKGVTRSISRRVDIEDELAKYSRTRFTLEELRKRPVPEGVDPSKLETYLSDEEFKRVFKITKEQFVAAPLWRQTDLKKRVGLF